MTGATGQGQKKGHDVKEQKQETTATAVVEVEAKAEGGIINVETGAITAGVRVKYRERGTRAWTKLLVIPEGDQTLESLLRDAPKIADAHRRKTSSTTSDCEAVALASSDRNES